MTGTLIFIFMVSALARTATSHCANRSASFSQERAASPPSVSGIFVHRRRPKKIGNPTSRRMLLAKRKNRDDDRNANECSRAAPDEGPEPNCKQNDKGRNRQRAPDEPRLRIA